MTTHTPALSPPQVVFPALGTTAAMLVTDSAALPAAEAVLRAELAAVDRACSRFRPDSELTRVNVCAGVTTTVSEYFAEALQAALRAARLTGGAVDPTVGSAVIALGYDRTLPPSRPRTPAPCRWPDRRPAGSGSRSPGVPADCACPRAPASTWAPPPRPWPLTVPPGRSPR